MAELLFDAVLLTAAPYLLVAGAAMTGVTLRNNLRGALIIAAMLLLNLAAMGLGWRYPEGRWIPRLHAFVICANVGVLAMALWRAYQKARRARQARPDQSPPQT